MKKFTSLLLSIIILTMTISGFSLTAYADGLEGDGTAENPYLIRNEDDYGEFLFYTEDEACTDEYFKLVNDITVTFTQDTDISNYPIGSEDTPFEGHFDGNGKTIEFTASDFEGMFGYVNNATISNLTVKGTISVEDVYAVGGIVCSATGNTEITNCVFKGAITNTSQAADYTAGICGYAEGTLKIENCVNYANINGSGSYLAGIVGYFEGTSIVLNDCVNYGNILGDSNVAGGIGMINNSGFAINHVINTGSISASGDVGGILNFKNTTSTSSQTVLNCINRGALTSINLNSHTGGIVGLSDSLAAGFSVINSANCGTISGGGRSGGIMSYWSNRKGYALILKNNLSAGEVRSSNAGAIIGYYDSKKSDVMYQNFYDTSKSSLSSYESSINALAWSDSNLSTVVASLNANIQAKASESANWLTWAEGNITQDGIALDRAANGTVLQIAYSNDLVSADLYLTGSVLSEGSLWIIIAVAVVAIAVVATLIVLKKKKAIGKTTNKEEV